MAKRKKGMQKVDVTKKEGAKELSDDTLEGASGGYEAWKHFCAEHKKNDPIDTNVY